MASSVSSSTSLLPKKRKFSNSSMPQAPETSTIEESCQPESSIVDSTWGLLLPTKRKASHDSSHLGSAHSDDAEAIATLPSLGSFGSTTSKAFLNLPDPTPVLPQQLPHSNLLKKRKFVIDDSASVVPKDLLSFDQQSVVTKASAVSNRPTDASIAPAATSALDHLDALGDETASMEAVPTKTDNLNLKEPPPSSQLQHLHLAIGDDNSSGTTLDSSNHRLLLEALKMSTTTSSNNYTRYGRDRLESWGGMSDLSVTGIGSDMGAAALAASALHHTGIIDDITAAANFGCADSVASSVSEEKPSAVPSRISLRRERKWSVASLSEVSATGGVPFVSEPTERSNTDAFVAAATLADQLSELAGAVEAAAASSADSVTYQLMREAGIGSDASSVASPLIGAMHDSSSVSGLDSKQRSRSSTVASFSQQIVDIDYEAVAAAVDAAEAVTCALDLTAIASIVPTSDNTPSDSKYSGKTSKRPVRRQLPLNKKRSNTLESLGSFPDDLTVSASGKLPPIPSSTLSDRDLEAIRERARAAAGYVPPTNGAKLPEGGACTPPPRAPFKKRAKRQNSPEPDMTSSTPKLSNTTANNNNKRPETPEIDEDLEEAAAAAAAAAVADSKGPANLKWEEMFQTLLSFIDERREEETKNLSEHDKTNWMWDGNVPTNFKTKDGKSLGRWINNQRSAKSKGALKLERENRLVDTGLRWSVLTSNSWNKMLEELRIYAEEQSQNGETWDGNVPTNYVIPKERATAFDEDKNLGRWVNRQRCLHQSGKLKKERKQALENLGMKWSMLATNSWDEMYESLCEYAKSKAQTEDNQVWDGNVPANHRTNDKPPRSLGRWVNRQRSAFQKNKLKKEYVDKLTTVGLRWVIHERKGLPVAVSPTINGIPDAVKSGTTNVETTKEVVEKENEKG